MSEHKNQTVNPRDLEQELYLLRLKKLAGELKETHKIRNLKKQIARLKNSN